jgi:predicted nuclease with TOPRIM domain
LPLISAEEVVKLFEEDTRARKRLAELLVSEPDVRLAIINAVLRDVATKGDIEALRKEFKEGIEALRKELRSDVEYLRSEVSGLRERVSKLEGAFTQLVDRMGDLDKRIDYTTKVS